MNTLKEEALKVFNKNPNIEKVYVTSDGQVFTTENYARLHAREKKLSLHIFDRGKTTPEEADAPEQNYLRLKKAELQALLTERGVQFDPEATKKELASLLETNDNENKE